MRKITSRQFDLLGLLLILLVATSLRLGYGGVIEYRKDEADLTSIELDIAQGKPIPFLGIASSIGLPNSPMTVYVLIPPFLISQDPMVAIAYIAILNVIGVGLLWLMSYRYFGRGVALVAGLAYAVNPWAVMYSRKIWAQDYHTPFILLAIFLTLYGFIDKKRWAQILCLPIFLIGLQIHFASWSLVPIYLWLVWHGRKNTTWRILAVSGLLSVIVMIPYAVGIVQSLGNYKAIFPRDWTIDLISQPAQHIANLTTGLQLEGTFANDQAVDFLAQVPQPAALWAVSGLFALMGMIAVWRKWPRYLAFTLSIWAFITVGFIMVVALLGQATSLWIESWPHYYIPSIPAFCLLIGIGVTAVASWRPQIKPVGIVTGGVTAAIFVTQFLAVFGLLNYVDTHLATSGAGFGIPLHYLLSVRDALRPYQDIVVINGDSRDFTSTGALIWNSLLHDSNRCIRDLTSLDSVAVFPSSSFAAVFGYRESNADVSVLKAMYQGANPVVVDIPQGGEPFQIYPLQTTPWTGAIISDMQPTHFSNALTLTGYNAAEKRLILRWVLPTKSSRSYTTVITYLSANNSVLGQHKEPFWQSYNWCMNDTLIDWMNIAPPNGTTQLGIGLEAVDKIRSTIATQTGETSITIPFSPAN